MEDKSFVERNMAMWEKLTGSYMDFMFKAMEKGMEQSAAIQKQIDKAVGMAVHAQSEATLAAIKTLEHQVEALSEKVDDMLKDK
jgi:hypothetical protein